jgi:hypothetical protein
MSAKKTVAVCDECHKTIRGKTILVVPPNYEILIGINSIQYLHPKCADKRGIVVDA